MRRKFGGPVRAIFSIIFLLAPAIARSHAVILADSTQRMMGARLSDGRTVVSDLPVHEIGRSWYIPGGEFLHALGLAVEVTPTEGLVEGQFLSVDRKFRLNAKECVASALGGKPESFPCEQAVIHDDDVFLAAELIEKLVPVRLKINSYRSEIIVGSEEELTPVLAGAARTRQGRLDPGYPRVEPRVETIDGFFIDQQIGYFNDNTSTSSVTEFRHDTTVTGELFGMESSYLLNGHQDQISRQRLTLSKHSVEGKLLGPAGIREVQLVDVNFPSVPMIGGAGLFKGGLISSYPIQGGATGSSQYGMHDFSGDLAAGWEVELYQNDVLIDRKASAAGRYEFLHVPLKFGVNRFRLAFYGPQGQRREGYETYSLDSSFLQPGEQAYRIAFADDIGANARWLFQYDRSLARRFNVFSAASRFSSELTLYPPVTYGLLGGRALVGNVLVTLAGATSESGGIAVSNDLQMPTEVATIGAGYSRLANFFSDYYKVDPVHLSPQDIYRANVTFDLFSANTVRLAFEATRTTYQDLYQKDLVTHRASTATGPIRWFSTINYDQSAEIEMNGELASQMKISQTDTRLTLNYDARAANGATLDLKRRLASLTDAGVTLTETFPTETHKQAMYVTRQFQFFTLTANLSTDNRGNFATGALLSYSVEREPRSTAWAMLPKPQAQLGSVSVYVFNDLNQNGMQDNGEKPVEGVEVVLNQQDTGIKTNRAGIAVMNGLPVQEPADISLSLATLASVRSSIFPKGVRVYPRAGKMVRVDFTVETAGEVAGLVRVRAGSEQTPKRGIRILLRRLGSEFTRVGNTDADGFFIFTDLAPGSYVLHLDPSQLRGLRLRARDWERKIEIQPGAATQDQQDFTLEQIGKEPAEGRRPQSAIRPSPPLRTHRSARRPSDASKI